MQKFGQAVVFLGVAALLYCVAAPHLMSPASTANTPNTPVTPPNPEASGPVNTPADPTAPPTDGRIAPPRTSSQREADDIETRRVPYFQWLHNKFGDVLAAQQTSAADAATLDLYFTRSDSSVVLPLIGQAVQPYADRYGFNHVRFFQPNPPGEVERYRFAAEAGPDRDGRWRAFEK